MLAGMSPTPADAPARLVRALRLAGARLADAWLPRACALCRRALALADPGLCAACRDGLPGAGRPRCPVCALPQPRGERCAACAARPPAFDRTIVLADYAPPLDRLILALKFRGELALARPLARALAAPCTAVDHVDGLVPVPLAPLRLAERGYNQSRALAAGVGRARGLPLADGLLRRVRETRPQSGEPLAARHDNLAGAFVAQARAAGGAWVVVDDVMTSGATLQATAAALKAAGARLVVNLVAARTLP